MAGVIATMSQPLGRHALGNWSWFAPRPFVRRALWCCVGLVLLPHAAITDVCADILVGLFPSSKGWIDRQRVAFSRVWTAVSMLWLLISYTRFQAGVCVCVCVRMHCAPQGFVSVFTPSL